MAKPAKYACLLPYACKAFVYIVVLAMSSRKMQRCVCINYPGTNNSFKLLPYACSLYIIVLFYLPCTCISLN